MNDDTYLGSETLPPDTYLGPRRYKITAMCGRCEQEFSWTTTTSIGKDRACPRKACKQAVHDEEVQREAANMARIIETQHPPGHIGDKVIVKAIDETAKIVMEDFGMTDLKDNIRQGDSMAPKLPGQQQQAADSFFDKGPVRGARAQKQMDLIGRRAMAGAYRGMALDPSQVLPGQSGESALRRVGVEKLRDGG